MPHLLSAFQKRAYESSNLNVSIFPVPFEQKLNKHMHSRSHHEAIERLKGGQQSHTCLACKVSALGLEQYVTHISTTEHLTNLDFLEDNCRKNGIAVDYNDAELNAICALRDQKRLVLKYVFNASCSKQIMTVIGYWRLFLAVIAAGLTQIDRSTASLQISGPHVNNRS
ncbi:hypothetical protein P4O66_009190 [Electrophorus voltai]|uniref:Uncharacterized protein n=1 Tax=Electrophorus voltai TaxID=2609070 RepID=A0AAD8ZEA0_9TELE|nr:hypothetical protein P4O66_009190 [Electrophorus voltai]